MPDNSKNHPQELTFADINQNDIIVNADNGSVLCVIAKRVDRQTTYDVLVQDIKSKDTYTLSIGRTYSGIRPYIRKIGTASEFDYTFEQVTVYYGLWNFQWKRELSYETLVNHIVGQSIDAEPSKEIKFRVYAVRFDVFAWVNGDGSFSYCHEERGAAFHAGITNDNWDNDDEARAIGVILKEDCVAMPNGTYRKIQSRIERLNDLDLYIANLDGYEYLWDVEIVQKHI